VLNAAPEFDDCVRLASANHLAVKDVQAMAIAAFQARHGLASRGPRA